MSKLVEALIEAQNRAMAVRPAAGGFPVLAEVLRRAGVRMNRWSLPSCQSIYVMGGGSVVQQGTPLVVGMHEIPAFDRSALIAAIRSDQEGHGTFPAFLQACWEAGVTGYDVDLTGRTVRYHGADGATYTEEYPAVEAPSQPSGRQPA